MSPTTMAGKLITAEEFARLPELPDGSKQELVRGVILTMPPPKGLHGYVCSRIDRKVGNFVDAQGLGHVFSNDTGFVTETDPDSVRGVDVAYWSKARLSAIQGNKYIDIPPDLAVEVVSPSDHFSRINRKLLEYLDKGVSLVWIVDPEDRTVTVYRPGAVQRILPESETLDGADVLPGFSCKVADLFP